MNVVIPPKALEQVDRLCSEEGELEVVIDRNHIGIRENDVVIFSRLIEGTYPNYEQVIPFYNNKIAILDSQKLSDALRRMLILANTITHRIRLLFKEKQLKVSVSTEEVGEGEDLLEAEYQDEEMEIFFNGNYLLEMLKYVESEQVKICMESSESGILVVPAEESENERYLGVIMPLKVTDR
jgi:DNA polymerase-3 subunit beta